jgi:hypothetical protein
MQGMHVATIDGGARRDQRLPEHLAAEHLRAADVAALAAEQVELDALELEQAQQVIEQVIHRRFAFSPRHRAASA